MKRIYITVGAVLLWGASTSLYAQTHTEKKDTTMNKSVVVEQEYAPEIMDANKVNVLPKVEPPVANKNKVEYATSFFPIANVPGVPMSIYSTPEQQAETTRGYARAGYGMYNNLDLKADYLFKLSEADKLHAHFGMDGMSGKLTLPFIINDQKKRNAFRYQTYAGVNYAHRFQALDLSIWGNFGTHNFNFLPEGFDHQHFNSGDVHARVASNGERPFQYSAEMAYLLFSRKTTPHDKRVKEGDFRIKGFAAGNINEEQKVGIGLEMNALSYSSGQPEYDSRTLFDLNPYYDYTGDDWLLHIGAHTDLNFGGAGPAIRFAPDVNAQYLFADGYSLYATATGGRLVNDFRRLESEYLYANPARGEGFQEPIRDTYEQLNTSIGLKASPLTGFRFNLFAGYQLLKDDLYESAALVSDGRNFLNLYQTTSKNLYAGIETSYSYKDLVTLSGSVIYRNWKAKDAIADTGSHEALLLKPKTDFNIRADIHPIERLYLSADYRYILRAERESALTGRKLPSVNSLNVEAAYNLFKGVSIYARFCNLLNCKYQYHLYYPEEGFNFTGGLSFRF